MGGGRGWVVVDGWTKTKLMLFSTQVEVVVELKLELSLAKDFSGQKNKLGLSLRREKRIFWVQNWGGKLRIMSIN